VSVCGENQIEQEKQKRERVKETGRHGDDEGVTNQRNNSKREVKRCQDLERRRGKMKEREDEMQGWR